jgi:hypothetical protein
LTDNIRKRLLIHVGAFNLGLLMRELFGIGTPRSLQGRPAAVFCALWSLIQHLWTPSEVFPAVRRPIRSLVNRFERHRENRLLVTVKPAFATGC